MNPAARLPSLTADDTIHVGFVQFFVDSIYVCAACVRFFQSTMMWQYSIGRSDRCTRRNTASSFACDDGAAGVRYVDDELLVPPMRFRLAHRLHKTMPPVEQLAFLRHIAKIHQLFDTCDFRFILRKIVDEITRETALPADACIGCGISHDEPFRPCVQANVPSYCGRRSDARNRTDQTTPVLTGGSGHPSAHRREPTGK